MRMDGDYSENGGSSGGLFIPTTTFLTAATTLDTTTTTTTTSSEQKDTSPDTPTANAPGIDPATTEKKEDPASTQSTKSRTPPNPESESAAAARTQNPSTMTSLGSIGPASVFTPHQHRLLLSSSTSSRPGPAGPGRRPAIPTIPFTPTFTSTTMAQQQPPQPPQPQQQRRTTAAAAVPSPSASPQMTKKDLIRAFFNQRQAPPARSASTSPARSTAAAAVVAPTAAATQGSTLLPRISTTALTPPTTNTNNDHHSPLPSPRPENPHEKMTTAALLADMERSSSQSSSSSSSSTDEVHLPSPPLQSPMKSSLEPDNSDSSSELTAVQRLLNKYPLNPDFLANYTVTAELGSGGFGHVLSAISTKDNVEVAVKLILKRRIPASAWARDRDLGIMPMEVYLVRRCTHPNVVGFKDFYEDERFAYLVMEMHGTQWDATDNPFREDATLRSSAAAQSSTAQDLKCLEQAEAAADLRRRRAEAFTTTNGIKQHPAVLKVKMAGHEESLLPTTSTTTPSSPTTPTITTKTQLMPKHAPHQQVRMRQTSDPTTTTSSPADLEKPNPFDAEPPSSSLPKEQPEPPSAIPQPNHVQPQARKPIPPPLLRTQSYPLPTRLTRKSSMDLFECIEQNTHLPERHARHVFRQIADAVSYLHTRGIVHRDLKDENIVIDSNLHVKLIDFGSAAFEPLHKKSQLFDRFQGTIQYAAPEILKGQKYKGRPSDVWAMGILLYTMLEGECPFASSEEAMRGSARAPARRVSGECRQLVDWMLEKIPERRPTAEQVLGHSWMNVQL